MELINKEIPGIILCDLNEEYKDKIKNSGRYKIYIPSYMHHSGLKSVIWCKNHIHKYRYGSDENGNIYGEYKPLLKGTRVIIKFFSNLITSGYIDRIISDHVDNCLPFGLDYIDQNDVTVILRTAKHNNLIAVLEDTKTKDIPSNSFHIYYDNDKVRIIMNENGHYTWITKNKFTRILQNNSVWIEKDNKHFISGDNRYLIGKDNIIHIKGSNTLVIYGPSIEIYNDNRDIKILKSKIENIEQKSFIHAKQSFNIISPIIKLNCIEDNDE